MEYKVRIGGRIHKVDCASLDKSGAVVMRLNDDLQDVVIIPVSSNQIQLKIGERSHSLFAVQTGQGTWVWANGRARLAQDADEVERRNTRGPREAPREVTPPTPAAVVRVLVEEGQEVTKGQGLVVVTAMKMEITLSAPFAGRVKAVNTKAGAQVKPGDILVEIEPQPEAE